jgi:hypothetical protein
VCEFIPPLFVIPSPLNFDTGMITTLFVEDGWSIEIKDVKE